MPGAWTVRAPHLVRLELRFLAFSRRSSNVLWVRVAAPEDQDTLLALASALQSWDSEVYAGLRSEDWVLDAIYGVSCGDSGRASYVRRGINQAGSVPSGVQAAYPAQVAPVVRGLDPLDGKLCRWYASGIVPGIEDLLPVPSDPNEVYELQALALERAYGLIPLYIAGVPGYPAHTGAQLVSPSCARRNGGGPGVFVLREVVNFHCDRHFVGSQVRRAPGRQAGTVN